MNSNTKKTQKKIPSRTRSVTPVYKSTRGFKYPVSTEGYMVSTGLKILEYCIMNIFKDHAFEIEQNISMITCLVDKVTVNCTHQKSSYKSNTVG